MRLRTALALALTMVIGATGLAACGDDDDDSSRESAASTEASGGLPDLSGQDLVYTNYGGNSADAAKAAYLEPFSKATGANFALDGPSDAAKVKAMVESGQTTWDFIDIDLAAGGVGCGTLYEKLPADFPKDRYPAKYLTDGCGAPLYVSTEPMVYNSEKFRDDPPTRTTDFFDFENYPGTRLVFNYPPGTVEPLLLSYGVPPDEVYPIDWDKVKEAIDALGDNVRFVNTVAEMNEALQSGNFAMASWYAAHSALAEDKGGKLGVIWDRPYFIWESLYAVKGSEHPDAQKAFMKFVAEPEQQANYTEVLPYFPAVNGAAELVEAKPPWKKWLPDVDSLDNITYYDAKWWQENQADALAKWTEITSG
jgi:putative spermidine/putrescine transport system substrate-binding protein